MDLDLSGKNLRILVFELNWMGDILFSFPFLKALRSSFPEAFISCAVVPGYAGLLKNAPWVDRVHKFPEKKGPGTISGKIRFLSDIRKEKYDVCFFLKPSRTKGMIGALAGIPERIGHAGKDAFLTRTVRIDKEPVHRADHILSLAKGIGLKAPDGSYEYIVHDDDLRNAEGLIKLCGGGSRPVVAVNPGGNWMPKRWPADNFRQLIKKLLERFGGMEVMITGADKDISLADDIVKSISSERCYSVAGKTGISELAALFKTSSLVISADSGPLHLASATGVPTIGLFGPTSPSLTGPRGPGRNVVIHKSTDCQIPCYVEKCEKGHICMKNISVEEVFSEAERMLS